MWATRVLLLCQSDCCGWSGRLGLSPVGLVALLCVEAASCGLVGLGHEAAGYGTLEGLAHG